MDWEGGALRQPLRSFAEGAYEPWPEVGYPQPATSKRDLKVKHESMPGREFY